MSSEAASCQEISYISPLKPVQTKTEGRTKQRVNRTEHDDDEEEEPIVQEPLTPVARLFHAARFKCHIVAVIGCKCRFNPRVIKMGLENTLIKHPRFSSKLVTDDCEGSQMKWERTKVNVDDHVTIPDLDQNVDSPNQFVEDYVSNLTTMPMDITKPLWELHILNIKTSDAAAVAVLRMHHSLGDGASLISLLLACTRKISDPNALPSIPKKQRAGNSPVTVGFRWCILGFWMALRKICNGLVDVIVFIATILFLKDTNTPIKGGPDDELKPKRFVHRSVSMDDIMLVKNGIDTTINDVMLGVTQAALSRYLNRRYDSLSKKQIYYAGEIENKKDGELIKKKSHLPRSIRLRATVLVNLGPVAGIQKFADLMAMESKVKWGWGNLIGYIVLPFTIALQDDPLDYIRGAKATIDRKKLSFESFFTYKSAVSLIEAFGVEASAAPVRRVFSNTTLSYSNVVGPKEEISFYGHPVAYLAPGVYGVPHALTIHCQSYGNKMIIVLAADTDAIPDPHLLCDDMVDSLQIIKDAAVKKRT